MAISTPKNRKQNTPRKPRYSRGERINRFEVLATAGREAVRGAKGRETVWLYRVRCLLCAHVWRLTQTRIRQEELTGGRVACPTCRDAVPWAGAEVSGPESDDRSLWSVWHALVFTSGVAGDA